MADIEKNVRVTCPCCGSHGEAIAWDEIDAQMDRRDARHILNEALFEAKCDKCGNALSLDYPLVYHDGEARFVVWYVADESVDGKIAASIRDKALEMKARAARAAALAGKATPDKAEAAAQAVLKAPNALEGYRYRIVHSRNALREKIVVLRNGLDDRAVEVLKVTTFNLAARQGRLKGATEPYFGGVKKSGDVIIDFVGGRRHREMKAPAKLYRSVCADVDAVTDGSDLVVDRQWAERFLTSQMERQGQ